MHSHIRLPPATETADKLLSHVPLWFWGGLPGWIILTQYDGFVSPATQKKLRSINWNLITTCPFARCHFVNICVMIHLKTQESFIIHIVNWTMKSEGIKIRFPPFICSEVALLCLFDCLVKQTSDKCHHHHHVLYGMSEQHLCFTASQWLIQDVDGRELKCPDSNKLRRLFVAGSICRASVMLPSEFYFILLLFIIYFL